MKLEEKHYLCSACGDNLNRVTYVVPWGGDIDFDWQDEHVNNHGCAENPPEMGYRIYKTHRLTERGPVRVS